MRATRHKSVGLLQQTKENGLSRIEFTAYCTKLCISSSLLITEMLCYKPIRNRILVDSVRTMWERLLEKIQNSFWIYFKNGK